MRRAITCLLLGLVACVVPRGRGAAAPVVLGADGMVLLESEALVLQAPSDLRRLEMYFAEWARARPDEELVLRAERGAPGSLVVAVTGLLDEAGVPLYRVVKGDVGPP